MDINVMDDNYAEAYALESFLIEEGYLQYQIRNYISECMCLESGNIYEIESINESLVDGIKNFFSRIWEFLKKTFSKFKERVVELFTTDKKFLEKYKDIILKNPWKNHDVTDGYSYMEGIDNVNKIAAVNISYENARHQSNGSKCLDLDNKDSNNSTEYSEEMFVTDILKGADAAEKATDIKEFIEHSIKGEQKDRTCEYYDKQKMYNFCIGFEKLHEQFNKNQDIINKNQNVILSALNKRSAMIDNSKVKSESVYSNVYGMYITEEDNNQQQKDGNNSMKVEPVKPTVQDQHNGNDGKAVTNTNAAENINKATEDKKKEGFNSQEDKDKEQNTTDNAIENCKKFFQYCVSIQTNLYTVSLAMYKDFMKLLRIHVRDYVNGEVNTGQDQAVSSANNTEGNNNESSLQDTGMTVEEFQNKYKVDDVKETPLTKKIPSKLRNKIDKTSNKVYRYYSAEDQKAYYLMQGKAYTIKNQENNQQ